MTPTDDMAFVGDPPLPGMRPGNPTAIHVSCCFTWDMDESRRLTETWREQYPGVKVIMGGPAFGSRWNGFTPGRYVKSGVTFTTIGCNNGCPWCLVPGREGRLREIANFAPGHIIQDNNILQASHAHLEQVGYMLFRQRRAAVFSGGIDARLVDAWAADWLHSLRIESLFLAADTDGSLAPLEAALVRLSFLPRRKLRVYTMIGFSGTLAENEARLRAVWQLGGLPFAQLYQPADHWIDYSPEWKALHRTWSRPAAMFSLMRTA